MFLISGVTYSTSSRFIICLSVNGLSLTCLSDSSILRISANDRVFLSASPLHISRMVATKSSSWVFVIVYFIFNYHFEWASARKRDRSHPAFRVAGRYRPGAVLAFAGVLLAKRDRLPDTVRNIVRYRHCCTSWHSASAVFAACSQRPSLTLHTSAWRCMWCSMCLISPVMIFTSAAFFASVSVIAHPQPAPTTPGPGRRSGSATWS